MSRGAHKYSVGRVSSRRRTSGRYCSIGWPASPLPHTAWSKFFNLMRQIGKSKAGIPNVEEDSYQAGTMAVFKSVRFAFHEKTENTYNTSATFPPSERPMLRLQCDWEVLVGTGVRRLVGACEGLDYFGWSIFEDELDIWGGSGAIQIAWIHDLNIWAVLDSTVSYETTYSFLSLIVNNWRIASSESYGMGNKKADS